MTFIKRTQSAIIPSRVNEFTDGAICRRFEATTPAKPSGLGVLRRVGSGALWVTEYIITYTDGPVYTVSIMEFRDGKVAHETQYFAGPFESPAWRAQWVEQTRR